MRRPSTGLTVESGVVESEVGGTVGLLGAGNGFRAVPVSRPPIESGCPVRDDDTSCDHRDTIRENLRLVHVVRREKDGAAFLR